MERRFRAGGSGVDGIEKTEFRAEFEKDRLHFNPVAWLRPRMLTSAAIAGVEGK